MSEYNSIYGAKVVNTNDPEHRGRIKVVCAEALGESISNWCEPCFHGAYDNGGDFFLPKIDEFVWIMFEEGDVDSPVYLGGWWSENNTPLGKEYKNRDKLRYLAFGDMVLIFNKEGNKITIKSKDDTDSTSVIIEPSKVTVKGKVYVEDKTTIKGNVSIDGNATVSGNLNVSGSVSASNIY